MKKEKLAALLSLALKPKSPPPALKARLMESLTRAKETARGESAEIKVKGSALVSLNENSRATLRRGARGLELLLEKGGATIGVIKGKYFSAQMPLGLVSVKGTWFYIESRGPKKSYVCLCEGWIGLSAPGLKTEIKTKSHLAYDLELRGSKTLMIPASKGHPHPRTSRFS